MRHSTPHSHPAEAYFQESYYPQLVTVKVAYNYDVAKYDDIVAGKYDRAWWLRSPRLADKKRFCRGSKTGGSEYKLANYSCGIVPCFVIY